MSKDMEMFKKKLTFLRKNTLLSPLSLLKINESKKQIDKARAWYYQVEGELLDADYSLAEELEYELRFKDWMYTCSQLWISIPEDIGLMEFAEMMLEQNIEKNINQYKAETAKPIDKKELSFLRANTIIDPISFIKINRLKRDIEKARAWYYQVEGELIDTDDTLADELEYEIRLKIWESKCANLWKKHNEGLCISEFAKLIMNQNIEKEKTKKRV